MRACLPPLTPIAHPIAGFPPSLGAKWDTLASNQGLLPSCVDQHRLVLSLLPAIIRPRLGSHA